MTLTNEQARELKKQLSEQIQHLPEEQKEQAQAQIDSMSSDSLEMMLQQQQAQSQKIFRMIVDKEIPSVLVGENSGAIAVLSTKSISRGHTLIIPKKPAVKEDELPKDAHFLSEVMSKKLIMSLGAKSTSVINEKSFGEVVINVIPIYDKPLSLHSPRKDENVEELEKIRTEINVEKIEKKVEVIKKEKKPRKKILKLKRRIP